MKTFKHYFFIILAIVTMISFTSCEDEEEDIITGHLVGPYGKSWEGDLGALSEDNYPLFSRLTFRKNGKGREELYYMDNGDFYEEYEFNWEFDRDNTILIYYRNGDDAYLRNYIIGESDFRGYWSINGSPELAFELHAR